MCGRVAVLPPEQRQDGAVVRKTAKGECIRVKTPLSLEYARRLLAEFVEHHNTVRLRLRMRSVTSRSRDKLAGREEVIWAERKR